MTPRDIIHIVADVHDVPAVAIVGQRRHSKTTAARQAAMVYLGDYLRLSTPAIAAEVNRMCHTTVLHARRVHARRLRHNTDSALAKDTICRQRIQARQVAQPGDQMLNSGLDIAAEAFQ